MYSEITKLYFFQRVRDIIDSVEVDDAVVLITYCDDEIRKLTNLQRDVEQKKKREEKLLKEHAERVYTVLTRKFKCIYEIMKELREKYPQYTWTHKYVASCLKELQERRLIEKICGCLSYSDPETGYCLSRGIGYRRIDL